MTWMEFSHWLPRKGGAGRSKGVFVLASVARNHSWGHRSSDHVMTQGIS